MNTNFTFPYINILLLGLCLILGSNIFAQNTGIGTLDPTHPLHIVPGSTGENPLRLDSLQLYRQAGDTMVLVVNADSGVVRMVHIDSVIAQKAELIASYSPTIYRTSGVLQQDINVIMNNNDLSFEGQRSSIIKGTGEFGVGTLTPSAPLHMVDSKLPFLPSLASATAIVENNGTASIALLGGNTNSSSVSFGDQDDDNPGEILYDHATNRMDFTTNTQTRATLSNSGYLGIGTSNPRAKLTVVGTNELDDDIELYSYHTEPSAVFQFNAGRGSETTPLNLAYGNRLGSLQFAGWINESIQVGSRMSANYLGNGTTNMSDLKFYTSNSERMTIDSVGNLQIGTNILLSQEGNLGLGTDDFGNGTQVLALTDAVSPNASITDGVLLWAGGTNAELRVRDEAGNSTVLSPHNFSLIPNGPSEELAWAYYSEKDGRKINVDMARLARLVEELSGEQLVYIEDKDGMPESNMRTRGLRNDLTDQTIENERLRKENQLLKEQIKSLEEVQKEVQALRELIRLLSEKVDK